MIKVSVIIPVYNCEDYIAQCINSVVNQTLCDIEIICINDGSTDKSLDILQDFAQKDDRIRIISQSNKGAGAARNLGLTQAKGNYLYFLDGDDYLIDNCLEKLYNKISSLDCDICVCQNDCFDDNSKNYVDCNWKSSFDCLPNNEIFSKINIPDKIFQFCNIPAFTKLYKHSFIDKICAVFQEIRTCNDVFFNLYTLSMADKICHLPESLIIHRQSHTNLTKIRHEHIDCVLKAFGMLKEKLEEKNIFFQVEDSFYNKAAECFIYEISRCPDKRIRNQYRTEFYKFIPEKYKLCLETEKDLPLFSVRNFDSHKVISIFGIKIKLKNKGDYKCQKSV